MTCALCGIISGVAYDILYVARTAVCGIHVRSYTVKDKIFTVICDVLYCFIFAAGFVFTSVMFDFYELRFYMLAGCLIGAFLYLKSFHIIVAFFVNKVYNKFTIRKTRKKNRRDVRAKAQQNSCGGYG